MTPALRQDLRIAIAQLRLRPAFVLGATLSLAIGMSLATALFSVMDGALRPLPLPHEKQLVELVETTPEGDMSTVPPGLIQSARPGTNTLRDVVAFERANGLFSRGGDARRIEAVRVTPNFFATLGLRPLLGGFFEGYEGDASAVISYELWTTEFGSDRNVIGQSFEIGREMHRVVGVMPPRADPFGIDIYVPLSDQALADAARLRDRDWSPFYTFARLRPGITADQASAELSVLYRRQYADDASRRSHSTRAVSLSMWMTLGVRTQVRLWGAAAIVILILCAVNFATMSLVRGMRRKSEIAVRAALGASRTQIVRALLVEASLFAALAGAIALVMAAGLLSFVSRLIVVGPLATPAHIGWHTILFGMLGAIGVGFAFAMAPALELAKVDLRTIMQGGASGSTLSRSDTRGQRALVALQLCLALTAVAVVSALIAADRRMSRAATTFDYSHLILADVHSSDSTVRRLALEPLVQHVRDLPNVEAAAAIGSMEPMAMMLNHPTDDTPPTALTRVSSEFFNTLRAKPLAGRLPSADEVAARAPVIVISHWTAMWAFGSDSAAVNQRVRMKVPRRDAEAATVIGVVPNLGGAGIYAFQSPVYQVRPLVSERGGTLVVRVAGEPELHVAEIGRGAGAFDRRLLVSGTTAVRTIAERRLGESRGRTMFLATVGALALVLAIIGIYGLTAYTTELRARELAIRLALGARHPHLIRVIGGELWWMAAVGIVVAMLASGQLVAFLDSIYRPTIMRSPLLTLPVGPVALAAATLVVIAAIGVALPLRRLLRLDVMRTVQSS